MPNVHPTAIVSPKANIGKDTVIGPYVVIGDGVTLGDGCSVGSHSCLDGTTTIGDRNRIGRHTCIGADPQDMGFKGEETFLKIGNDNFFGDYVQICRGTSKSHDKSTHIGNNNYLMAYTHVGHDCIIKDHVIAANAVQLAGHVEIDDRVYIGGIVAIHQFVKIGKYAMVSGGSATSLDIPPYVRVAGYGCAVYGLNVIGLKRAGFSREAMANIKALYDRFFRIGGPFEETLAALEKDFPADENIQYFVKFARAAERGLARVRDVKE